jgi:hypothetical protein
LVERTLKLRELGPGPRALLACSSRKTDRDAAGGLGGVALWRLTVHGVEVPGRWVVCDREFWPEEYSGPANHLRTRPANWSGRAAYAILTAKASANGQAR